MYCLNHLPMTARALPMVVNHSVFSTYCFKNNSWKTSHYVSHQSATVRDWLGRLGVKTLYIETGSPWDNGYCENFISKLRE